MKIEKEYCEEGHRNLCCNSYIGTILAINNFSKAININPNFTEAYYFRGIARFIIRDLKNAIADFSEVINLDPYRAYAYVAYCWRGSIKNGVGDCKGAIEDWEIAKTFEPNPHFKNEIQCCIDQVKAKLK